MIKNKHVTRFDTKADPSVSNISTGFIFAINPVEIPATTTTAIVSSLKAKPTMIIKIPINSIIYSPPLRINNYINIFIHYIVISFTL